MSGRNTGFGLAVLCALMLVGCGGGGSKKGESAKALARQRLVATARIARHTLAMAGLGRRVSTRAPRIGLGNRAAQLLLHRFSRSGGTGGNTTPAPQQGQDEETGLYYTLTLNADGSGVQDLFTDSTYHTPAGQFVVAAPQWANALPDTYPATFHLEYQITAGDFAGDNGTIDFVASDSTGNNGTIHLLYHNALNETAIADFKIVNGVITATDNITLSDGSHCTGNYESDSSGDFVFNFDFFGGDQETMTIEPDGDGTQSYQDSSGQTQGTGDFNPDGEDTLQYDDGSWETWDVDTGDTVDTGTDDTNTDNKSARSRNQSRAAIRRKK